MCSEIAKIVVLLTLIEKFKYPKFLLLEGLLSFPYFALNVPYVDRLLRALPSVRTEQTVYIYGKIVY